MKNKIVWLAEWNNGQDYENNDTHFVGIYSTKEKADIAVEAYHENQIKTGGTYNPGKAGTHVYKVEVDK